MKRKLTLAAITTLALAAIGSAYAANAEENDAAVLAQAKIRG